MLLGLKTVPSVSQTSMNSSLSGLQSLQCFVYLNDIVVYTSSLEPHYMKLQCVFDGLRKHNF